MRRTLRIFPLYYFALAFFLILLPALATIPSGFQDAVVGKNWLWFYGTNIKMSFTNQWCFGAFDHFWSLAVEEHFYLIWPIVIYSLSRRSAIAVTVAGAAIISTARIAFACFSDPGVALDVATWFRADSLLCGSFFALLIRGHRGLEGALPLARTAIIFGAITSLPSILLPEERIKTIPHTTFALLFGGLLVELLNWQNHTAIRSLFTSRSLTTLGKLSYGMYVYQLPLLALSAPWLTASSMSHWTSSALVARLGYLAIMSIATLACAYASWQLLEKHYLKLKDSFTASSRVSTELSKTTPAASPAIS